jgi:uncharacterized OB-fold protein
MGLRGDAAIVGYTELPATKRPTGPLEWREISGAGTLYTFTVSYRAVSPHFADDVPQPGGRAVGRGTAVFHPRDVNAEPDAIRVGMRVRPVFTDYPDDGITMLRYEPA